MRVTMMGTGYVGLVSGACFADFGHTVCCVDKDTSKIDRLERAALVTQADGSAPLVAVPSGNPEETDLRRLCEMFLRGAARRGHSRTAVLHAFQAYLEGEVPS